MLKTLRHLVTHPLNRADRPGAILRFLRWQLSVRLMRCPQVVPFVDDTVLVMERGMTGATGNWYSGLHEEGDMAFVLHMLRAGDLFVDIGANVGSYTVLAGGAAGAQVVTVEPIPATFARMRRNVRINGLEDRVSCHNIGAGSAEGTLHFTADRDTTNHVVSAEEASRIPTLAVPVRRIDDVLAGACPVLMKIDVEGWEAEVLRGMPDTLACPTLVAVVMETNAAATRYHGAGGAAEEDEVTQIMQAAGFRACSYDPFARQVLEGGTAHNTIFIRDLDAVRTRVAQARRFALVNGTI